MVHAHQGAGQAPLLIAQGIGRGRLRRHCACRVNRTAQRSQRVIDAGQKAISGFHDDFRIADRSLFPGAVPRCWQTTLQRPFPWWFPEHALARL
jgi:hypothetical protein